MIAVLRLLPMLIRRSRREAFEGAALCAVGVAVATLLGSSVTAAYLGFGARDERVVWREPLPAIDGQPTLLSRRSLELFDGREIDVVQLAPIGSKASLAGDLPVPPGLRTLPAAGHTVVSPALSGLIASTPPEQLGNRFGPIVGIIGDEGLAYPDELVAVTVTTAAMLEPGDRERLAVNSGGRERGSPSSVTPISRFDTSGSDDRLQLYRSMVLVALALVVVPAMMLVGSAARLTAARREQRLAIIRLAGATPCAVRLLAAAETGLGAAVGAVGGVGASLLLAPSMRDVEIGGGGWFVADLRLSLVTALALVVGAIILSVLAAMFSLRRVMSAPLGVTRAAAPRPARWPRVLGAGFSFAFLLVATYYTAGGGSAAVMVGGLAVVISSLSLVGPWITALVGRAVVNSARRPGTLLAGRRLMDDPASAYRIVAAVVLAGLVAGFLAGALPAVDAKASSYGSSDELAVLMDSASAVKLVESGERLAVEFPGTTVRASAAVAGSDDRHTLPVLVRPGPGVSVEQLRTATVGLRDGLPLISSRDDLWSEATLIADIRRGARIVLIATILLAAASSAVAAAASVVDQRRTIRRLALAGVSVAVLQQARRWQSTLPLLAATFGAVVLGFGSAAVVLYGFGQRPEAIAAPQAMELLVVVGCSALLGAASAELTRPLLVVTARSDSNKL